MYWDLFMYVYKTITLCLYHVDIPYDVYNIYYMEIYGF